MDNPYRITEEEIRQIEECITSSRPLPGAVGKKVVTTLRTLYVGNEMTVPADSQVAKVFNTAITRNRPHAFANQSGWFATFLLYALILLGMLSFAAP